MTGAQTGEQKGWAGLDDATAPLWPAGIGQERHWAYQQRFSEAAGFNIPVATLLTGPLDVGAVEASIRAVTERHEALRSIFVPRPGGLRQRFTDPGEVPVTTHDLRGRSSSDALARLRELGAGEAARPFDLAGEPTTRAHLVRVADDRTVLLLNAHHIAFDGWSSPIFYADLDDQYSSLNGARPPQRRDNGYRYVDYTRWQRRRLADGSLEGQLEHWRTALADPWPAAPWPTEGTDPAAPWWEGDMVWLSFPGRLVTAARDVARSRGTTLFVLLLTTYQLALQQLLGVPALGVGTALAGRTQQRWEDVIGFFVNTAVLPYRFDGDLTFERLLARTHRTVLDAHANQDVPYGVLLQQLAPPVEPDRTPYFQTMFLLQNYPSPERRLGDARARSRKLVTGSARYDITFALDHLGDELTVELENRTRLVSQDTAIALAQRFFGLLAAVVDAPGKQVGRLHPAEVPVEVHRRPPATASLDGLFSGLVADWRPA